MLLFLELPDIADTLASKALLNLLNSALLLVIDASILSNSLLKLILNDREVFSNSAEALALSEADIILETSLSACALIIASLAASLSASVL